ncbi:hypothetical protein [Macrococcus armenti]|uniref:hypothetical protein n=1 Tax=Macrococcus armenti TaxID=2875764 RepID=UPI001CD6665C|nr:hypothetical protein [Macrococcus armenti]UBH10068.1 hypothetical protein LAU38_07215 [Macrococcus armenti]
MNNSLSLSERISSILLLAFGLMIDARAVFWIIESKHAINDSPFYSKLNEVAPLWIWGCILLIFGTIILFASYAIPKRLVSVNFSLFVLIGCTGSAIFYFFLTVVSMADSLNWLTPVSFLIQTSCLGICGFVGGIDYARKR